MDFTNLNNRKSELLDFLKTNGYSKARYELVRGTINWILKNNNPNWKSYEDVIADRVAAVSKSFVRDAKSLVNTVYRFDVFELMPAGGSQKNLLVNPLACSYVKLSHSYKELVDKYKRLASVLGTSELTIKTDVSALSSFLYFVQNKGAHCLSAISESLVLDYVLIGNNGTRFSTTRRANLKRCFTRLVPSVVEFQRLLTCLPHIKHKRTNIQYLSEEEMDAVKGVLDDPDSKLSKRDRAMGLLLVHTWLRCSDITNLTIDAIDWDKETLSIITGKTGVPTTQKLSVKVLNALWDYIENERPASVEQFIFLTHYLPHKHIKSTALYDAFNKIFDLAGIRQKKGDRRGCHLARHFGASMALSKGVPRHIITDAVAHSSSGALDTYLHADLVHLKACALSIDIFPITSEVYHG